MSPLKVERPLPFTLLPVLIKSLLISVTKLVFHYGIVPYVLARGQALHSPSIGAAAKHSETKVLKLASGIGAVGPVSHVLPVQPGSQTQDQLVPSNRSLSPPGGTHLGGLEFELSSEGGGVSGLKYEISSGGGDGGGGDGGGGATQSERTVLHHDGLCSFGVSCAPVPSEEHVYLA